MGFITFDAIHNTQHKVSNLLDSFYIIDSDNQRRVNPSFARSLICSFAYLLILLAISGCHRLPPGCPPECSEVVLRKASLNGVDLSEANLTGAILIDVQLKRANLKGANLSGANLTGANLVQADLSGAELHGIILERANLSGANLDGADLSGADLTEATLTRIDFRNVNLNAVVLNSATLIGAELWGTDLKGAQLVGADIRGSNLVGANLSGASIGNQLKKLGANLSGADMRGVRLIGANLAYANLTGADLSRAKMRGAILSGTIMAGVTLTKADLREAEIVGTNLSGAVLDDADLTGANIGNVLLNGANLQGAKLEQIKLAEVKVLFSMDLALNSSGKKHLEISEDLDYKKISRDLQREFEGHKEIPPPDAATVSIEDQGRMWVITDNHRPMYTIKREGDRLNVYEAGATFLDMSGADFDIDALDLKLELTQEAPAEILICDSIPLTFVVRNLGGGPITNLEINSPLPANVEIDGLPEGGSVTTDMNGQRSISFHATTLLPEHHREFSVIVRATQTGPFTNTTTARAGSGLTAESSTTTIVRKPVLTIAKTGMERLLIGENIIYEITVGNTGDGVAANATLKEDIPKDMIFVSASDGGQFQEFEGKVVWEFSALSPNESKSVNLTVTSHRYGTFRTIAQFAAPCAEPVKAATIIKIGGNPASRN